MMHSSLENTGRIDLQEKCLFSGKKSYEPNFLIYSYLESTKIINGDICSSWLATASTEVCACAYPLLKNHIYISTDPLTTSEQFLRAIWEAISQAIVPLALNKTQLTVLTLCVCVFSVNMEKNRTNYYADREGSSVEVPDNEQLG